jgi:hypothetical protein
VAGSILAGQLEVIIPLLVYCADPEDYELEADQNVETHDHAMERFLYVVDL